ncbi:MAG: hypothetical protein LBK92_04015 [Endomicrobium sp.]|nr:hypothetical protein [Endomicrobium sp.]
MAQIHGMGALISHNVWTDGDNNFWIIGDDDAEQEDNDANQEEADWADTLDPEFGVPRRMLFPAGMEDAYIQ